MISPEVLKRIQQITETPEFRKLSVHKQILYLRDQGIDFTKISGWGNPTPEQQEVINHGPSYSITEQKMDGEQPKPK